MPKLQVISGKDAIKKLEKIGYSIVRQKGSHVRLKNPNKVECKPITVPLHKNLKKGLLHQIIKDSNYSPEDFFLL